MIVGRASCYLRRPLTPRYPLCVPPLTGLHINTQTGAADPATVKALGLDSAGNYCWYHTTPIMNTHV